MRSEILASCSRSTSRRVARDAHRTDRHLLSFDLTSWFFGCSFLSFCFVRFMSIHTLKLLNYPFCVALIWLCPKTAQVAFSWCSCCKTMSFWHQGNCLELSLHHICHKQSKENCKVFWVFLLYSPYRTNRHCFSWSLYSSARTHTHKRHRTNQHCLPDCTSSTHTHKSHTFDCLIADYQRSLWLYLHTFLTEIVRGVQAKVSYSSWTSDSERNHPLISH